MDKRLLSSGLDSMGIECSSEIEDKFERYMELLLDWNCRMNLTAITDEKEIVTKHFLDSASCLKIVGVSDAKRMIDVGTGAGFPGLPLRILASNGEWVLADALGKRVNFLRDVIDKLELSGISAIHSRAEELGRDILLRESFDVVVSRAVANLAVLSEYCLPLVSVGGLFLSMKGPKADKEIDDAEYAIKLLGGIVKDRVLIKNPYMDSQHEIIVIKKVSKTPEKYPRKSGKPSKKPILQGDKR